MKKPTAPRVNLKKLGSLAKPVKRAATSAQRPFRRAKGDEERVTEALQGVPRITNETVAEHREEVLSSARKYIYPLQHSKHHVVRISIALFVSVIVLFFAYCTFALYKLQSTSGFLYGVTQVVPFPVAKVGNTWISYENYLFELRRNMHYYQTQQRADFTTKDGKNQLQHLRQQALAQVTQDAYVKQLAAEHQVSVSSASVNNQVELVRRQNRLGSNDRVFKDVLNQFWGWSEDDFKRELKQQLLQQAVVAKLDTATQARATTALKQIQGGSDFATVAAASSDDLATKATGGQYPAAITLSNHDIAPQITAELFKLKPGQVSNVVNTGYTLEILTVTDASGGSLHASHIQFTLADVSTYIKPIAAKHKVHDYIKV